MYFNVREHRFGENSFVHSLSDPHLSKTDVDLAYGLIEGDPEICDNYSRDCIDVDLLVQLTHWSNPYGLQPDTRENLERILGQSIRFYRRALSSQYPEIMTLECLEEFFQKRWTRYNSPLELNHRPGRKWVVIQIHEKISFGGFLEPISHRRPLS